MAKVRRPAADSCNIEDGSQSFGLSALTSYAALAPHVLFDAAVLHSN